MISKLNEVETGHKVMTSTLGATVNDAITSLDMTSLGYSNKQMQALKNMPAVNGEVKVFGGFATAVKVGRIAGVPQVVVVEMKRRGVRFLPKQVIRRILEK